MTIWDVDTGLELASIPFVASGLPPPIVLSPDGSHLANLSGSIVSIWQVP
jgi:hypothetical protein